MAKTSANAISASASVRERLKAWFRHPLGQYLMECEQGILDELLPNLFGYHIIQLGLLTEGELLRTSPITHRVCVQLEAEGDLHSAADLQCTTESIPLAPDSIDVVVLQHVLEYSPNPHKLLREIHRTLIGEGHLIIIGFNPRSFCGIWRTMLAWRDEPPWNGQFFSINRIKDWFSLLDFELVDIRRFFYRPPFRNMNIMEKLGFLEKLGNYCWSVFGGIYIIVVKKHVIPLTPIKVGWHKRRDMIASGFAEPTARCHCNGHGSF